MQRSPLRRKLTSQIRCYGESVSVLLLAADFAPDGREVRFVPILVQKSVETGRERDSVVLTRISARSIHDGPSEEWVFGDEFASSVDIDEGKSISKMAIARLKESVSAAALFTGDLVDAVKAYGARALPGGFNKRPYMKAPKWKKAKTGNFPIYVKAALYQSKGYNKLHRKFAPSFVRSVQRKLRRNLSTRI
jgi:hypothetical protein